MNRERLVPKLRFEEFENDEEWVTYELGDISDVTKLAGFEYTKYVIYSEIGSIIALRGLNIKNGKIILDDVKYIDQSDFSKLDRSKLYQGDIILTYVGTIGNLAVIPENDKYYLAPNVARIRLTAGINPEFVTQRMGSRGFYRKIINPLIATSSQPALSMLNIRKFTLKIPGYKEQVKIGIHLKKLDELIQLQQSKVNKVKDIKSAYLSEMFPKEGEKYPKKRFEGFIEPWEEYKLKDMGRSLTGLSGKSKKDFGHGEAEFVTYMNVFNNPIAKSTQTAQVEIDENQTEVEYGDIFFTVSSETPNEVGMSSVWLYDRPNVYLNSFCFGFRPNIKLNPYYMAYMLRSPEIRKRFILLAQGISRYNISKTKAMELLFPIPSNEEQEKIGQFFKNSDKQITIEEEKLSKLEKLKQAYLNDMFV